MLKGFKHIDIDEFPEFVRLAEEVEASGLTFILQKDGQEIAALVPTKDVNPYGPGRVFTEEDLQAARSAAGGWEGIVDAEKLKEDIYESRGRPIRTTVER